MYKLNSITLLIATLFITFSAKAQEPEFNNPTLHGDGGKNLRAHRDNLWDNTTLQWNPEDSVNIIYNTQGLIQQETIRNFNGSNWVVYKVRKNEYNTDGSSSIIIDSFPSSTSSTRKYIFTYNTSNQKSVVEEQRLNSSAAWTQYKRSQYSYTSTGNINTQLTEGLIGGVWKNMERLVYTYNGLDQKTMHTSEIWNGTAWIGSSRRIYTYTSSGSIQILKEEVYDNTTNQYINFTDRSYTYNTDGKVLTETSRKWDATSNVWLNEYRFTSTYNAQKVINSRFIEKWISTNWQNSSKTTYSYINGDWCSQIMSVSWNTSSNQWDSSSKYSYTYDATGYITKYTFVGYNTALNTWSNVYEKYFWYNSFPTSIQESNNQTNFITYPNPMIGNELHINLENESTFKLLDMQGKILQTGNLNQGKNSIQLSQIPTGTYFIQVGNTTQRILKTN